MGTAHELIGGHASNGQDSAAEKQKLWVAESFASIWLPTLDNLRNFLLTTTTEVISFFHQLREAP